MAAHDAEDDDANAGDQTGYERWRGDISAQLVNMQRQRREDLDRWDQRLAKAEADAAQEHAYTLNLLGDAQRIIAELQLQVSVMSTRIGMFAGLGGLVGAVIVGLAIWAITGALGGSGATHK